MNVRRRLSAVLSIVLLLAVVPLTALAFAVGAFVCALAAGASVIRQLLRVIWTGQEL